MCPADARPDVAEGDEADDEASPASEASGGEFDLGVLRQRADVAGILALAKAHRSGTAPGGRDLEKCFEAYRAAAELGSGEAQYAVALFHINGGTVVPQDLKEGTTHLRAAADKGSVAAKVYLGNLYELGIHYKADPEKADVWYRNAARTARVSADQGTAEWTRSLAELGCARHVLELTSNADAGLDAEESARLLARAKAHGYGLKIREEPLEGERVDRATFAESLAASEEPSPAPKKPAPATAPPIAPATKTQATKTQATKTQPAKKTPNARRTPIAAGLGAFGYAVLFMVAGIGAGYAATLGARELVSRGHALPIFGAQTRYVFPAVLALVGVLPAWLVYEIGTVFKSVVVGAVLGGVGWVAWGTGQAMLHADRALQALAFGLAGFLAGLLVFGLLGGVKAPR